MRRKWAVLGVGTALLVSAPAGAQEAGEARGSAEPEPEAGPPPKPGPHTAGALQLGVGFRYGAMLNDAELNPWGTGLGLSAGYTLPQAVYLGGNFEYFFGESADVLGAKVKLNIWQLSAEGGYDIGLGESFVIRPKLGVGIGSLRSSISNCPANVTCEGSSDTKPLVAPGATFMLFTSHISFSLDARYAMVFTENETAKALIFSFGIGF